MQIIAIGSADEPTATVFYIIKADMKQQPRHFLTGLIVWKSRV
jgi:hypothetical protein